MLVFVKKRLACRQADIELVVPELRAFYQEPLLTREQEQHLFRQFNYSKFKLAMAIDQNAKFPDNGQVVYTDGVLSGDLSTIENYYNMATEVKQQIVACNTRLVMNIAKSQKGFWHGNSGIDLLSEVVAEGNVGLIRAVDYFDFRRGFKFSTYATWVIKDTIVKAKEAQQKHETTRTGYGETLFNKILDDRRRLIVASNKYCMNTSAKDVH